MPHYENIPFEVPKGLGVDDNRKSLSAKNLQMVHGSPPPKGS